MPRLPDLAPEKLSPAQRKVYDAIVAGPRGVVQGPLKVWLNSAELASRAQELGAFCRYHTSLPKRLSELAILITGAYWKAGFEWFVHAPAGISAGLDPSAVEAIRVGQEPKFSKGDEAALYAFTRELLEKRRVSDATYKRAVEELGELGAVELVGILGYYALISMTIVAFQVPLPEGEPEPFA
ncbi:MAG TPA: carboxymuconolactone decarboxylase family protein [Xanthobacteraceae bacterium]|nr:carboxymuconolactone decarboxylase family protein [Xanthobacteraceae bacterium]